LFSGDALYDGQLIDDFPTSDIGHYRVTMQRLDELPIRVGHGGHGPSFDNARKKTLVREYLAGKRTPGCPRDAGA
jgi:glyoxylase-like metal-dependent hydrolase (beta-lactamase superfamily II)